ncbi:MarR family transcriptional regulator [Micromonospora arida]|uniref:MarR family transcriptional regulator n=1 Tax=Micromonospora arida TaxID=2203715 RepID=UPI0033F80262
MQIPGDSDGLATSSHQIALPGARMTPNDIEGAVMALPMQADVNQVAAYWTRLAYESIIRFTRDEQAKRGFTQPQFWILRHLSPHDLAPDDGAAMTIPQLQQAMTEYIRPDDDLASEAEVLLGRGWIHADRDGCLRITDAGEAARLQMKQSAPEIRSLIHRDIDDADYVAALRVLHKLIANTTRVPETDAVKLA